MRRQFTQAGPTLGETLRKLVLGWVALLVLTIIVWQGVRLFNNNIRPRPIESDLYGGWVSSNVAFRSMTHTVEPVGNWTEVAYGGGYFIATLYDQGVATGLVSSTDGVNWSAY